MGGKTQGRTLADYFTLQRGTTYKSALLGKPGPVLLGLGTIKRNGGFRNESLKTYGGESPDKLLVQPGELYLSLKDVTQSADLLGAVARLPAECTLGRLTQDTVKLEPRSPNIPIEYLYWLLRTPQYRSYCRSHATGTTNLGLAREDLLAFPVPRASKRQQLIVETLRALEEKIELNCRRNETSEAMARALFQDWFVDFGPVCAKMESRDPYLPAGIWSLFPECLDGEGKPEGWRYSTIGAEVAVCGGSTPSTKESAFWNAGNHHWATPKDLAKLEFPVLLDTDRKITDAGVAKISSGVLPAGTVLLSSRAPIGYLAITEVPTAINQGFIAMRCDGTLPNVFALFWCRENMDVILGNANGSTFQEISKSNFRPIPVTVPPERLLEAFRECADPLYRHIVENERESQSLVRLRDTLLPKLVSGELRLKDAERFVEERAQ